MGSMVPLVKVAGSRVSGLALVTELTLAGLVSSALVGASIALGGFVVPRNLGIPPIALVTILLIFVAVLLVSRPVPLPQIRRQTNGRWAKRYPAWVATGGWGFDIGLTFSTWRTFTGAWMLAILVAAFQDVSFGVAAFAAYWIGRVMTVWLAPLYVLDANSVPDAIVAIQSNLNLFRLMHALGLVTLAATVLFSGLA